MSGAFCVCRCLQLDESIELLHDEVADLKADRIKLEAQLTAAARCLGEKHRLMAEVCCLQYVPAPDQIV